MALVEFVEYDCVDAFESGTGEEAAGQDSFGDEAQTGPWADLLFESDLIANCFAGLFAQFPRDTACGQARGDSAGLEHDDCAGDEREDCGWDAGGLPCPGWRFDEEVWSALQGGEKLRQNRIHRE
jgi:hypothetical protein